MHIKLLIAFPLCIGALVLGFASAQDAAEFASGVVFHDVDRDGILGEKEPRLSGVGVSNGRKVVQTDENGRWRLPAEEADEFFVIKPSGWMVPVDENNLPQFFYIHRPKGSPDSRIPGIPPTGPLPEAINFPLLPQDEPEAFDVLLFGDTQPRNQQEVDWIAEDVVDGLVGWGGAFGVTLGDVVFDNLGLFKPLSEVIGEIGVPWFQVVGNHDVNREAIDQLEIESFIRHFGPATYSLDWGPAHFVVLDNVFWSQKGGKPTYEARLRPDILDFVRNDLALVPREKLVVFLMHIPLGGVAEKKEFFELFEDRPATLSVSAHRHVQEHFFFGRKDGWGGEKPHHHLVNVTVCGSWWSGALDEDQIPHATMSDGAPNGWPELHVEKDSYRISFHAARSEPSHQINLTIKPSESGSVGDLYANVFNGSEATTVEFRLNRQGAWQAMDKTREEDPHYLELVAGEQEARGRALSPRTRKLPKAQKSSHLWKVSLPLGTLGPGRHIVEVRANSSYGFPASAEKSFVVKP